MESRKKINPRLIELARKTYNPELEMPNLEEGVQIPVNIPESTIQSTQDYWRVSGVNYRGGIYVVDLAKQLLPSKTQDEHAKHRNQVLKRNEFYTGDIPLYHALFTTLFKQKDKPESEKIKKFIKNQMRKNWLITLTRIAYQPKGKDRIIHNYGTSENYELEEYIAGQDRFIETEDRMALETILGAGDITQINSVYNWINGTNAYIWRLNNKPRKVDERVARFDAGSDGADLGCGGRPGGSGSSLGVRACRARETGGKN